jgi:mono/diheme cytochrome c family protein
MKLGRRILVFGLLLFSLFLLGACAPPSLLPDGPTPIPTLAPVEEPSTAFDATATPSFSTLSYPAGPPAVVEGQGIYVEHCAECHGEDGTGAVPGSRNFRDLDYMRGETPADFYVAVTEGRGDMTGYDEALSSDERWDVVFYVWRLSTSAEVLSSGKATYAENCALCHGENGDGELLGSSDFSNLREMSRLAPRDLYQTVTQGRGSMPAMQSLLSQDDRWAAIDYLRTFTYDPSLPEEPFHSDLPESSDAVDVCNKDQTNPLDWDDDQAIQAGQEIYQSQCANCHGQDGIGGLPDTPDFTSTERSTELRANSGQYLCSISEGIGMMPAYGSALTEAEQWQLITYLASLGS